VDSRAAATSGAWVVGFEAQRYPLTPTLAVTLIAAR